MREIFKFAPDEGRLLKEYEDKIKYINGFDKDNRTTRIDYAVIDSKRTKSVPVLRYKIFDAYEDIVHGFSTRLGGVSSGYLSSLNLSFSRGDSRENVIENHARFAGAVGYDCNKLVFSDQVHGDRIYMVTKNDMGKGIIRESDIKDTDGLVTDVPQIPLMTFYADCVPLYFYDPVKKVVGMAHSGWRGTVKKIGSKMIDLMEYNYGSERDNIVCAIPDAQSKCLLDNERYDQFFQIFSGKK